MNCILVFIWIFGLTRLCISLVNWLTEIKFPDAGRLAPKPFVSILIPARNEEERIGNLLAALSHFRYTPLEIIVYDDNSTDRTAQLITTAAVLNPGIRLIKGSPLPEGWLGKNYACHRLALEAKGEFLLFLDADVLVEDGLIDRTLGYMKRKELHLLSVFPKQLFCNPGTRLSVPLMNWILLSLLPLPLVPATHTESLTAANGQFMLFRAGTYYQLLPHQAFRNNPVEDMAIAKAFKKQKFKIATLLGDKHIQCNMYNSLQESIQGFSKNIFSFFGNSKVCCILFALVTTSAPFIIFLTMGKQAGYAYICLILLLRLVTTLASRQPVLQNLLLIIPQHLVFLIIIITALQGHKNRKIIWKNRNIYSLY
ncbi:MAG: glycosyltransferase [Tannerellaceae bacterium]|nr:glycosyltransferase [Tannerellaceae bacterium]MCD8265283.1 glycosyltransferase [Tannerellaceae bacterium]